MSRLSMKDGRIVIGEQDEKPKNTTQKTNTSNSRLSMVDGRIVLADKPAANKANNQSYLQKTQAAQREYQTMDDVLPQRRTSNMMDMAIDSLRNRVANSTIGRAANEWTSRVSGNIQNVLNESPEYRAAKRQARADNEARRQQFAIDTANIIDQASAQYEGPTRTETVRGRFTDTEGADMFSNDWEPGEEKEIEYTRTVRNENYNPLSREDRDALISRYADAMNGKTDANGYQQVLYDVTKNGGIEQLYREQQADAANDREYGRQLRGVDLDSMNFLQRLGGTLGGTVAGAGEQIASSGLGLYASNMNAAALNAANDESPASYRNALDKAATNWYYGLVNGADDPGMEENIRRMAAYVGGDSYADDVIRKIRERAEKDIQSGGEMGFSSSLLDEIESDNSALWRNLQGTIEESGAYDAINQMQASSQKHIQYAKDVNLLQNQFGDNLVEAGVSTIQNAADAAMAATLGLSGTGVIAMIPFALRAYGGSYAEQLQQATELGGMIGQDVAKKAAQSASISSAIEVGTEMMWGMVGAMSKVTGGGALDDAAQERLTEVLSGWAKTEKGRKVLTFIGEKALGGVTEGLEEVIGDAAEQMLKNAGIMPGEADEFSEWVKNAGHSFVTGALGGLLGETTSIVMSPMQKANIGQQVRNGTLDVNLNDLVDMANAEGMENSALAKTYSELFKGMPRSVESLSNYEVGKLYDAYGETITRSDEAIERLREMVAKVESGEELKRSDVNKITNNPEVVQQLQEAAGGELNLGGNINERRAAVEMAMRAFANGAESANQAQAENVQAATENASTPILQRQMDYNAMMAAAQGIRQNTAAEDVRNSLRTEQSLRDNVISSARSVYNAAERLGASDQAQDVMAQMYSPGQNTIDYAGKMTSIYNRAKAGDSLDASNLDGITMQQAQAVHNVGRMEYLQEEAKNGEESGLRVRNGVQGNDSQSAGGKTEGVEGASGSVELRESAAGFERRRPVSGVYSQPVSAASLGIRGGSNRANIRVLTESKDRNVQRAKQIVEERGYKAVLFTGGALEINGQQARGYYDPETNTMYIRADHRLFTADQIARHEAMHDRIRKQEVDLAAVRDDMIKRMGGVKNFERTMRDYYALYEGTGESDASVFEEAVCDAAGDMNEFMYHGHWNDADAAVSFYRAAKESAKATAKNVTEGALSGPVESDVGRYSRDHYDPETAGIKEQIANAADKLNAMEPADTITVPANIKTNREAAEWAINLLKKTGYKIDRQNYGRIVFGEKDIRNGARYATNNAERAAFAAVPSVLKRGIEIGRHNDHKARSVQTITFAAPVVLNGVRGNMAVVINAQGNHYKTHRIVMPDGTTFILEDVKKEDLQRSQGVAENSSLAETTRSSATTVAEQNEPVKGKFSMDRPVESTDQLIALHNLSEDKLLKAIKLGGFPMPSIAVTKSNIPHTNFGDITLVMNRSTVDPEMDSRNTVYSADAWTPTFPNVEYEANPAAEKRLRDLFYSLERKYGREVSDALYGYGNYLEDELNRRGGIEGILKWEENNTNMMKAYLKLQGKEIPDTVVKETVERIDDQTAVLYDDLLAALGDASAELDTNRPPRLGREWFDAHEEQIKEGYRKYFERAGLSEEDVNNFFENEPWGRMYANLKKARKYQKEGKETRKTETDYAATEQAVRDAVDQEAYKKWLHEIFDDSVKSEGIYNGRDYYDRNGNRRSFSWTHVPVTLDNIAKAMAAQNDGNSRNVSGFYGVKSLRAGTAERFKNIADMHKLEGRLKHLTQEEADAINDELGNRLSALMQKILDTAPKSYDSNPFMEMDAIGNTLMEISEDTPITIDKIMKRFKGTPYKVTVTPATEIRDLLFDISQMPVNIFEAKPERAVRFDEVLAAIVPAGTSEELVNGLKSVGVENVMEYEKDNDEDRIAKVNSVEGARFSRDLDGYLMEHHKEYENDETNRKIAAEGVQDLIKGAARVSAAEGEVDMAKQRKDIRTLGNGISAQFVKTGRVNLNGTRIRSAEDLAQVGQIFRNPKFETLRYLYVKKGKIVGTDSVTAMLPGISPAFSKDFQEADLIKKIARTGADGVYLLHNHPSGDVTPSRQDFGVTGKLAETIQNNTKAKFMGHVVIDHETYAQIDVDTNKRTASWEQKTIPGQSSFDFLLTPSLDNENLGKEVLNAGAVAAVGKEIVNSSGYSAIIYASSKGYVRQLQEVSDKALKNNKQIGNYIRNQRVNSGAGMAFVYTKDRDVYDALVQVYGDDILTDVVLDGAEFKDMRKNVFQREGMYMGVKEGEIGGAHANEETAKFSRDLSNTELYEANRQLQKDLSELRSKLKTRTEQYKYWKGQTKVTEGRQLRIEDVTKLAREIIKGQDSSADAKAVAEKMKALGEYILNTTDENVYDEARLKAYEVAHDILSNAKVLNEQGGEHFYKDFRDALKQTPIYVTPSVREEVSPDGWSGLRQMAKGIFTPTADKSKGKTVDVIYHDLQSTFGEWLLPEYITSEADQLNKIFEVVETYQPVYENINSYDMADATEWTANEILTRIIGEEIRETNPTYADRMEKKLSDQKVKSQEALRRVREQRDRKVQNLKDHYQQVAEDRRNRKIDSEMRTRLLNIAKRLNNKKLDRATRALLDQYIGEIDLVSKGILGRTIQELETLRDWYDNWVEEQKAELGEDFVPDTAIENRIKRLSKKRINDLTQEEVADLTTVLLNIEHQLRTQHEFIDSEERRDTYAAAMAFREDYQEGKSSTENAFARAILFGLSGKNKESGGDGLLTPERAMHRLGNYNDDDPGYKLGKELSAGQRKMLDYQMKANALFDAWLKDKKFIDSLAGKNAKWITVKGLVKGELTDVRITPAMRMSLYLHAKNEQNLNHIEHGGVLIPNEAKYKKGELNNAYKENYGTHATFSRYMIHEIAKGMSEKERAFADMAYWYFNNMSKDAINETSEMHKGYPIATVEKYFPIESSRDFLKADFGMLLPDGSVAGQGFLNERNVKSTNPIMLYDMNDVLTKSIAGHSRYYGLALPVQNLNKMMNVIMLGQEGSIRNMLLDEHVKYIDKMVRDVQTGAPGVGGLLSALRSNYAGGVLVLNGGVAVKQAASYPTAAAVLGYMPLVKALKDRNKKVDLDLIAKYTPLLWYRSKGYSTAELGDIGNRGGIASKVTSIKQLNWIQGVDVWTTTKLWTAAEYYVKDHNKALTYGTDAFYKAVAEVYNRVIEETQPNYTAMQRPGVLRSDNQLTRALNMFKTQPFQNANILIDAYGNMRAKARQNKANPTAENTKALKEARKTFARAVTSQALSAFTFALMQAIWDMARGKFKKYKDDDDEATFWSVNKQLLLNMVTSFGGMVPYGGTILEFIESSVDKISTLLGGENIFDQKFYGFSENSLEAANDLGNTSQSLMANIIKAFQGKQTGETSARNIVDGLSTLIHMSTGLPAPNVIKDMQVLGLNAWRFYERFNGGWDEKSRLMAEYASLRVTTDPAKYKSDYYALLKKAWTKDQAAYEELRKMMIEAPGDPFATAKKSAAENIDAKVKDWMKEKAQQSEEKQTFYGTVYDEMTASSLWDKAPDAAKDKALEKLLNLALEMGVEGTVADGAKSKAVIEGGKSVGLDATEYMLYQVALQMANPDGGNAKNAEYEEAINMVPGLSNEEKSYLWSTTHDSDKNNPWK